MAKSLRSKWKRKCRAKKRERYGLKELDRLNKILKNSTVNEDIKELVNVTTPTNLQQQNNTKTNNEMEIEENDDNNQTEIRYENGRHPIWMHPRKYRIKKKSNRRKYRLKKQNKKKN